MAKRKSVAYIVGGSLLVEQMFEKEGYQVTNKAPANTCDVVVFTGGEDVTPFLYGEKVLTIDGKTKTYCNPTRDMEEIKLYHRYVGEVPLIGVCRGAQLLNVLSGGTLWQHVDNHTTDHDIEYVSGYSKKDKDKIERVWSTEKVTSTHHQQMRPGDQGDVIGFTGISRNKYTESSKVSFNDANRNNGLDPEIIYYWHTNSLCFQPHPEYTSPIGTKTKNIFFDLVNRYLNISSTI